MHCVRAGNAAHPVTTSLAKIGSRSRLGFDEARRSSRVGFDENDAGRRHQRDVVLSHCRELRVLQVEAVLKGIDAMVDAPIRSFAAVTMHGYRLVYAARLEENRINFRFEYVANVGSGALLFGVA